MAETSTSLGGRPYPAERIASAVISLEKNLSIQVTLRGNMRGFLGTIYTPRKEIHNNKSLFLFIFQIVSNARTVADV